MVNSSCYLCGKNAFKNILWTTYGRGTSDRVKKQTMTSTKRKDSSTLFLQDTSNGNFENLKAEIDSWGA